MTTPVQPGDILAGKYQVEKVIGTGGMGVVVSAKHLQLGERVAIKFLLPHAACLPEVVQRFIREGRAAVRIRSEHVARVIDVGTFESGLPYLVMEFLDGQDLSAILRTSGPVTIPEAIEYVLQACEALAEAHSLGIIHRDLKPGNLFLSHRADGSPVVKVIDFGISRVVHPEGEGDGDATKTAVTMGSPQYMAPEQMASARSADARSDIWSLGVILHCLIAGVPPFRGSSVMEVYDRILQGAPPLRSLKPEVPALLEAAVLRCLLKDPALRFANVAELAQAIAEFAPEHARISAARVGRTLGVVPRAPGSIPGATPSSGGVTNPTPAAASTAPSVATSHSATGGSWGHTRPPTPRSSRMPVVFAIAALSVGGLAAGGFFILRNHTATPATASPEPTPQPSLGLVTPAPPETPSAAPTVAPSASVPTAAISAAPVTATPIVSPAPRPRPGSAPARPPKDLFNDPR